MPGKVHLGDYGYVAELSVVDDFAHLFLSVVAAVASVPKTVLRPHGRVAAAESAYLGKLGMRLDFEPPALVVSKVQVQDIEVMHPHKVYLPFQSLGIHESPRHVNHQPPVGTLRGIKTDSKRQLYRFGKPLFGIYRRRKLAQKVLDAVEHPGTVAPGYAKFSGTDSELEALRPALKAAVYVKDNPAFFNRVGRRLLRSCQKLLQIGDIITCLIGKRCNIG